MYSTECCLNLGLYVRATLFLIAFEGRVVASPRIVLFNFHLAELEGWKSIKRGEA